MGSLIVRQVIDDLIPLGLGNYQRTELLMAGSSAGGLGVMLNLDNIMDFLQVERGEWSLFDDEISFYSFILFICLTKRS